MYYWYPTMELLTHFDHVVGEDDSSLSIDRPERRIAARSGIRCRLVLPHDESSRLCPYWENQSTGASAFWA